MLLTFLTGLAFGASTLQETINLCFGASNTLTFAWNSSPSANSFFSPKLLFGKNALAPSTVNLTPCSITFTTLQLTTSLTFNCKTSHGFSVNCLNDKIIRFLDKSNSITFNSTSFPTANKSFTLTSLSQDVSLFGKNPWICSDNATTTPELLISVTVPLTN